MAEYYKGIYERGGKKKSSRNIFIILFNIFTYVISLLTIVAVLLTYMAPYVNPKHFWVLSILGLCAPATYFATLLLLMYWVVRWRWGWATIFAITASIGLCKVDLFYKFDIKHKYNIEQENYGRDVFKFMSYNVRSFYGEDGESSVDDIVMLIENIDPDIICMQEYNVQLANKNTGSVALFENYNSAIGIAKASVGIVNVAESPLVIYSKYEILRSGSSIINVDSVDTRPCIWADILIQKDTIRVFNSHLHSTSINALDDDFITNYKYLSDPTSEDKIMDIVRRFKNNCVNRSAEVNYIAKEIKATKHQKIVAGDFNDTPMSYAYNTMARGMNDAFSECGEGYSHTFRGFFNALRIDYILSSDDIIPQSYEVLDSVNYSDHLPVIARFKIK